MEQVINWLQGSRNFLIGRAIYRALGPDPELKTLLDKGCNDYSAKRLAMAMQELAEPTAAVEADVLPPTPETARKSPAAPKKVNTGSSYMAEGDDTVLKAIRAEWLAPYKKMQYLVAQLDQFGSSNEPDAVERRKELAAEILDLEQRCMALWAKRDHYLEHGALPTDKKTIEAPKDPLALATLINRIKRNIRTNRQQMDLHPDKPAYAKKYLDYKTQFQQLTGKQYQEVGNE